MDIVSLGSLRARRVTTKAGQNAAQDARAPLTVVLLHGFGAPGDDLVGLASEVAAPAGTTFLFPEAPLDLARLGFPVYGEARAWWMIDVGRWERAARSGDIEGVMNEVPAGLAEAHQGLSSLVDALEAGGTPTSRMVLGGFSQGSMVATDLLLRESRPFAGLAILSGAPVAFEAWKARMPERRGVPVFQSHGSSDPILPWKAGETLHRAFEAAGQQVRFERFDGGHGIAPSVLRALGDWIGGLAQG